MSRTKSTSIRIISIRDHFSRRYDIMRTVCSFCDAVISPGNSPDDLVSHGVCRPCHDRILATFRVNVKKFLDLFDAPVFLVDENVNILAANTLALAFLAKSSDQVTGILCGSVLECCNACLTEGCGHTPYCRDCAIRNSVSETFSSGMPVVRRHAAISHNNDGHKESMHFLVTTEREEGVVLLRLEPCDGKGGNVTET